MDRGLRCRSLTSRLIFDKSKRMTLVKVGSLQSRADDASALMLDLSSTDWMREPVKSWALGGAVVAFEDDLTPGGVRFC